MPALLPVLSENAEPAPPWPRRAILVLACLLAIIAIGTTIRAWHVVDRPLWEDEAYTWKDCQVPYARLLLWKHDPAHGPLSHILVRHSMQLFGSEEPWALRMPALLCGVLCMPAAFWLGRRIGGARPGLLASALVAVDPNMVDQSQQARMYTLLALLTLILIGCAIPLLRDPPARRRPWLLLGVLLSVQFATNYGAIVLWAALAASGVVTVLQKRAAGEMVSAISLLRGLATAYVVAVLLSFRGLWRMAQFIGADRQVGAAGGGQKLRAMLRALDQLTAAGPLALLVLLLAGWGLYLLWRRNRESGLILAWTAVIGLLMIYAGRSVHHIIALRYFTMIQPVVWLGLATLCVAVRTWPRRVLLGSGAICLLSLQLWQATHIDHWVDLKTWRFARTAAQFIQQARRDGERFTCTPYINFSAVSRYYDLIEPADDEMQRKLSGLRTSGAEDGAWMIAYMHHPRSEHELTSLLADSHVPRNLGMSTAALVAHVKAQKLAVVRVGPEHFDCWVYDPQADCLRPAAALPQAAAVAPRDIERR